MDFLEIIEQTREVLKSKGRVTYRTLKRQFGLDDEALEDFKEELLYSTPQVIDDEGRGLIWNGAGEEAEPAPQPPASSSQSPSSHTPQHLAERIRAEQQAMESRGAADGERKTITALFADLKGSTATRQILGTTRGHEPGPAMATTRQDGRSTGAACSRLQLVHRRF